jgi:hypothetical protein
MRMPSFSLASSTTQGLADALKTIDRGPVNRPPNEQPPSETVGVAHASACVATASADAPATPFGSVAVVDVYDADPDHAPSQRA